MLTLKQVKDIAEGIFAQESRDEDNVPVNMGNHLEKIAMSHGVDMETSAKDFFLSMLNDDFYGSDKMPSGWKDRTISGALESMLRLVSEDAVATSLKEEIGGDEPYNQLKNKLDKKKKEYMNAYKRIRRSARKEQNASLETAPQTPTPQVDTPVPSPQQETLQTPQQETLQTPQVDTPVPTPQQETPASQPDDQTLIKQRLKRAQDLLEKYMEHETDEFKVLYLEIIIEELQRVL